MTTSPTLKFESVNATVFPAEHPLLFLSSNVLINKATLWIRFGYKEFLKLLPAASLTEYQIALANSQF